MYAYCILCGEGRKEKSEIPAYLENVQYILYSRVLVFHFLTCKTCGKAHIAAKLCIPVA